MTKLLDWIISLATAVVCCALLATVADAQSIDRSSAVLKLEMPQSDGSMATGSAVLIGNGIAVTAEHMGESDKARLVTAFPVSTLYEPRKNSIDEAKLLRVSVNEPIVPIGPAPNRGDRVVGYGYPAGRFRRYEGRVVSVDDRFIVCDFLIDHGASGGGLFNERGELIGIASAKDPQAGQSIWIHTSSIIEAIEFVQQRYERRAPAGDVRVVVLSRVGCAPCERLKRDIREGKFPGYTFEITTFDDRLGTWDNPALYAEFRKECQVTKPLPAPVIWVPGTGKYKAGYNDRPGLIGWLESVLEFLFHGPPQSIPLTPIDPGDGGDVQEQEAEPEAEPGYIAGLRSELQQARDEALSAKDAAASAIAAAAKARDDLKNFQEGGVIQKIRAIAALKEDKRQLEDQVRTLKDFVDRFRDAPLRLLFGLLSGLITGPLQSWVEAKRASLLGARGA